MEVLTIILGTLAVFTIVWVGIIFLGVLLLSLGAPEAHKYEDLNDIPITDKREGPRARGTTQQKNKR